MNQPTPHLHKGLSPSTETLPSKRGYKPKISPKPAQSHHLLTIIMSVSHEAPKLTKKDTPATQNPNLRKHPDGTTRQQRLETSKSRAFQFKMLGRTKERKPLTTTSVVPITRRKKMALKDSVSSTMFETVRFRGKAKAHADQPPFQPSSAEVVTPHQSLRMINEKIGYAILTVQSDPNMETSANSAAGTQGEASERSTEVPSSNGPTRSLKRKRMNSRAISSRCTPILIKYRCPRISQKSTYAGNKGY